MLYEIPAGKIEVGEEPYQCGIREMEEETGLIPKGLELLTVIYPAPGFSSEKLYIYLADEFNEGTIKRDEDEFMDIKSYTIPEVLDMIKQGKIKDAKTICGILIYTLLNK